MFAISYLASDRQWPSGPPRPGLNNTCLQQPIYCPVLRFTSYHRHLVDYLYKTPNEAMLTQQLNPFCCVLYVQLCTEHDVPGFIKFKVFDAKRKCSFHSLCWTKWTLYNMSQFSRGTCHRHSAVFLIVSATARHLNVINKESNKQINSILL